MGFHSNCKMAQKQCNLSERERIIIQNPIGYQIQVSKKQNTDQESQVPNKKNTINKHIKEKKLEEPRYQNSKRKNEPKAKQKVKIAEKMFPMIAERAKVQNSLTLWMKFPKKEDEVEEKRKGCPIKSIALGKKR